MQSAGCVDRLDPIEAELSGAALTVEGLDRAAEGSPAAGGVADAGAGAGVAEPGAVHPAAVRGGGRRRSPSAREAAVQRWGRVAWRKERVPARGPAAELLALEAEAEAAAAAGRAGGRAAGSKCARGCACWHRRGRPGGRRAVRDFAAEGRDRMDEWWTNLK